MMNPDHLGKTTKRIDKRRIRALSPCTSSICLPDEMLWTGMKNRVAALSLSAMPVLRVIRLAMAFSISLSFIMGLALGLLSGGR